MRKLLTTSAMLVALATSGMALAADDAKHDGPPSHMKEALAKLPESKRELVENTFKSMHEQGKASHEQMKKLHDELKAIMVAPTFDKAAYLAKHKQLAALRNQEMEKREQAMADLASKLTQDERKTLADAMPHPGMHRPGGKFGKHADKGDAPDAPPAN
ncbi:periplasmic heavy metal sensor [bacterium]|nr:periplasmic heavy metal sensor [bacterium]